MSSENDREWRELTDAWQTGEAGPPAGLSELHVKVRRQSRLLVSLAIGEVLFTLALMAFLIHRTRLDPEPSLVVATVLVGVFVAVTFAFTTWNRRGLWRAETASTIAHAELMRKRCLGRLRTVRFSYALLAAECLFLTAWLPWRIETTPRLAERGLEPYLSGFGAMIALTAIYVVVLVGIDRRSRRELREVEALLAQLAAEPLGGEGK
ncbi:MAG: hypothetical protein HC897_12105 [Thermoanaerobaculia bacterium]|nr:hypothetical protein [Thermoanaerobaculia bacterium]